MTSKPWIKEAQQAVNELIEEAGDNGIYDAYNDITDAFKAAFIQGAQWHQEWVQKQVDKALDDLACKRRLYHE